MNWRDLLKRTSIQKFTRNLVRHLRNGRYIVVYKVGALLQFEHTLLLEPTCPLRSIRTSSQKGINPS